MATVTTTTVSNPLIYPSQTQIERVRGGDLWVIVAASTANTYELWRSQNAGTSWTLALSTVRANIQEIGCIQVLRAPYNQLVWMYRTYEGGRDNIHVRTISDLGGTLAWNTEVLLAFTTAASAGDIFTGFDMTTVVAGSLNYVIGAVGTRSGSSIGVTLFMAQGSTLANLLVNNNAITGSRTWFAAGSGRVTPSIDVEHTGDGHSTSTPHIWVGWGRTQAYLIKGSWTGGGWACPATPVQLNPITLTPAQDSIAGRWDGNRFNVAVPDPSSTSVVTVFERNRANSTTTIRQTPTHPTGVVRNCSLGYNSVTGDLRVYAVGTSTAVLYYVDYIRATGTWSSWATVTATAILGSAANNYSIRRATDGRYEVLTAHSGSPNTIVHTAQTLSYTPNVPVWDSSAMQLQSGSAYDVNTPLLLDWIFSDPDPADTQSAYAVSRQIGAGALNYWRASDSTWQVAEVQNTSGTSAITLPAAWGAGTDAATTFKAKVWDSASVASGYGDGYTVIPSTVVNPTVTSPTQAQVLTQDTITPTWTVAEETAFRTRLHTMLAGDAYGRTVGAGGFGTADYGGAYTTSGGSSTDYSVSSGAGRISCGTVAAREVRLTPPVVAGDFDVIVGPCTIAATPTGNVVDFGFKGRYTDANNFVEFRFLFTTSNTVTANIWNRLAGSDTVTAFPTIPGLTAASSVMMHCQAVGDTLNLRVWSAAASEPTNVWHITMTGATQRQAGTMYAFTVQPEAGNTNTLPLLTTVDGLFVRSVDPVYDSGWKSGADLSALIPVRLTDLSAWTVGVATRNLEGLASTEQVVGFTVDFVEPAAPTVVATPDPTNGVINVAITNAAAVGSQPTVADQDLYSRPNVAGANQLSNPGFEVNTTGWSATGGATLTRSTAQFHSGVAAGLLTPDGVSALPRVETPGASLVTVAEGQTWTVDGWLRATTANKPVQIAINWHDVANTFVTVSLLQVTPIAGAWLYVSASFAVPVGVSVVKAGARVAVMNTPAAGDTLHFDDMRLRRTDTSSSTGTLVSAGLASGATVADWRPVSGVDYEYRVLTRGVNGTSIYGPWTA